jgi:hypothetical protein
MFYHGALLLSIKEPDKRRILPVFSLSSPYIVAIGCLLKAATGISEPAILPCLSR